MKRTYTLTIHVEEQLVEEYNKLVTRYDELTAQECQDFDFLRAILDTDSPLQPADDTSTIHWLPVNGTVPPTRGTDYLVRDSWGNIYISYAGSSGKLMNAVEKTTLTHYAELPTFEPVQIIPDYITRHTCDGCGQAFTAEQWEKRYTPHEADCPCFDVDFADSRGDFACTCDRNFHVGCYTDELREQDNNTCDMLRVLHPDRYAYAEEAE